MNDVGHAPARSGPIVGIKMRDLGRRFRIERRGAHGLHDKTRAHERRLYVPVFAREDDGLFHCALAAGGPEGPHDSRIRVTLERERVQQR